MNQDVDNQIGGGEPPALEDWRITLRKERGRAMTDGLMKFWKWSPRHMAEMYAQRCIDADPLTQRYYELVDAFDRYREAHPEKRVDDVAAENYRAAEIDRRGGKYVTLTFTSGVMLPTKTVEGFPIAYQGDTIPKGAIPQYITSNGGVAYLLNQPKEK